MAKTRAQWEADSDAHTLASAAEIKDNPSRLNAAKSAATKLAVEVQKEAATVSAKLKRVSSGDKVKTQKSKTKPKRIPPRLRVMVYPK